MKTSVMIQETTKIIFFHPVKTTLQWMVSTVQYINDLLQLAMFVEFNFDSSEVDSHEDSTNETDG